MNSGSPEKPTETGILPLAIRWSLWIEGAMLVVLLASMIGLVLVQILLRNFFGGGLLWGDDLVRIIVLWTGLSGAICASRQDNHIAVNLIGPLLSRPWRPLATFCVRLFTSAVCALVAWYSLAFVQLERQAGTLAFASVPVWVCESIIPFAFGVIAWRYLLLAGLSLRQLRRPST